MSEEEQNKAKNFASEYSIISLTPAPPTVMACDLNMLGKNGLERLGIIGEYDAMKFMMTRGFSEFGESDNRAINSIRFPDLKVELNKQRGLHPLVGSKVQCLPGEAYRDKFFVTLSDIMGSDAKVQGAASKSFGKISKTDLTKYVRSMLRRGHTSPFESCEMAFEITVPKSTAIQLLRHRTGNFNEFSTRYAKVKTDDYYVPPEKTIVPQSALSKQGRSSSLTESQQSTSAEARNLIEDTMKSSFQSYDKMIEMGIAKEVARGVLPLDMYTSLFVKFDLNNLMRFLKLRLDGHAQMEISALAEAMFKLFVAAFPITASAFIDYVFAGSSQKSRIGRYLFDIVPANCIDESPFKFYGINSPDSFPCKLYGKDGPDSLIAVSNDASFSMRRMLKNLGFYMRKDTDRTLKRIQSYYDFHGRIDKDIAMPSTSRMIRCDYDESIVCDYNKLYSASCKYDLNDMCIQRFRPSTINNNKLKPVVPNSMADLNIDVNSPITSYSFGMKSQRFFSFLAKEFWQQPNDAKTDIHERPRIYSHLLHENILRVISDFTSNNTAIMGHREKVEKAAIKNDQDSISMFLNLDDSVFVRMMIYLGDNFISYESHGMDIEGYDIDSDRVFTDSDKLAMTNGFMYASYVSRIIVEVLQIEPNLDRFAFFKFMSFLSEKKFASNDANITIADCLKFMKKNDKMFGESEYIDTIIYDSFASTINYHYYLEGVSSIRENFLEKIVAIYINAYTCIIKEMPDFDFNCWKRLPSEVRGEIDETEHVLTVYQATKSYIDHAHSIGCQYILDHSGVVFGDINFSKEFSNNSLILNTRNEINYKIQETNDVLKKNKQDLRKIIARYLISIFDIYGEQTLLVKIFGINLVNLLGEDVRTRNNMSRVSQCAYNIETIGANIILDRIIEMIALLQPGIQMNNTLMQNLFNNVKTFKEIGNEVVAATKELVDNDGNNSYVE